jgi:cell division protein FtsB
MKKLLLPFLLLAVVALVLSGLYSAGDKHVEVVDNNATLSQQNTQLKSENSELKTENTQLIAKNENLIQQVEEVTMMADSIKETNVEKPVPVIVQDKIEAKYGWATPNYVFELLVFQLDNGPTKQDYKASLLEVLNNKALYYPSEEDPEQPGKIVKRSEIDSLVNLKF